MRHASLLAAPAVTALAAIAAFAVIGHPSASSVPVAAVPATDQRYGIVRMDATTHQWGVLATPPFQPFGLTTVTCSASTGVLKVGFDPLATIGTFTVNEDGAYAGRVLAGASIVPNALRITFRQPATGQPVACNSPLLAIPDSSLQLWVLGTNPAPPITTPPSPLPPSTTRPPISPSSSVSPSASSPFTFPPPSGSPSDVPTPPTID